MRPLHVPEILVVERLRQRLVAVLEGVDRPVLGIEERAVVMNLGPTAKTVFTYLEDSKKDFSRTTLTYSVDGGATQTVTDDAFPWEVTLKLPPDAKAVELQWTGTDAEGERVTLQK